MKTKTTQPKADAPAEERVTKSDRRCRELFGCTEAEYIAANPNSSLARATAAKKQAATGEGNAPRITQTQHTPGPWSQDPEGEVAITIEGADGSIVCDVHGVDAKAEANASLIASAPTILTALNNLLDAVEELEGEPIEYNKAVNLSKAAQAAERAAIDAREVA